MTANESLSNAVIREVADAKGVDPLNLTPPLFEVVDGELLNRLFRDGTGEVSFEYAGFQVTVDHEANVTLVPILGNESA